MNRNKRCQNSFVCFSNEKVIFVFVGLQYDSMKPNHAKKSKKITQKTQKTQKAQNCTVVHYSALQCTIVKRLNYSLQMDQI